MHGHFHYDCEEFCEHCLPVSHRSEGVDLDTGEQDSFANCSVCGRPLDCQLTTEGVKGVIEAARDSLREPAENRNRVIPKSGTAETTMTYYHGSRHVEIVRDWISAIKYYSLTPREKRFIELFLYRTAA